MGVSGQFRRQMRKDKEWLINAITNYGRVCRKGVESGAWWVGGTWGCGEWGLERVGRPWSCGKWGLESGKAVRVWKVGLGDCGKAVRVWKVGLGDCGKAVRVWKVGLGVLEGSEGVESGAWSVGKLWGCGKWGLESGKAVRVWGGGVAWGRRAQPQVPSHLSKVCNPQWRCRPESGPWTQHGTELPPERSFRCPSAPSGAAVHGSALADLRTACAAMAECPGRPPGVSEQCR